MLVWSSEFTTASGSIDDILSIAKQWIVGSPHAEWQDEDFHADLDNEIVEFEKSGQVVHLGKLGQESQDWAGCRWEQTDGDGRRWITEFVSIQRESSLRVSVRVHCHLASPGMRPPRAKKPYIVRQLLSKLGGGRDGPFSISDKPYTLQEHEVSLAASLVKGKAGNSLPVVYFSASKKGHFLLDPEKAARWFSGMAHVVVEPSTPFSYTLARETDGKNVYGGAVGILWPGGQARTVRFFPERYDSKTDFALALGDRLREALTFIQPTSDCTWATFKEQISSQAIRELQNAGVTELEAYMDAFDSELAAKDETNQALEAEIRRLKNELLIAEAMAGGSEGATLIKRGMESPLYPGEIEDAVIDALERSRVMFPEESRRRHIVEDLLDHNKSTGTDEEIAEAISKALNTLEKFGAAERQALEEVGFVISESGKHVKAVFHDDERYTFTIPKTPSDHRSGKNTASQIRRSLF